MDDDQHDPDDDQHDPDDDEDEDDRSVPEIMLEALDREVGSRLGLRNLDDAPLPDEPFACARIADDIICRANETAGAHSPGLSVQDLLASFGVEGGVSQRAEPFLHSNGVDPYGASGRWTSVPPTS